MSEPPCPGGTARLSPGRRAERTAGPGLDPVLVGVPCLGRSRRLPATSIRVRAAAQRAPCEAIASAPARRRALRWKRREGPPGMRRALSCGNVTLRRCESPVPRPSGLRRSGLVRLLGSRPCWSPALSQGTPSSVAVTVAGPPVAAGSFATTTTGRTRRRCRRRATRVPAIAAREINDFRRRGGLRGLRRR
jgi:hypothetical protein